MKWQDSLFEQEIREIREDLEDLRNGGDPAKVRCIERHLVWIETCWEEEQSGN